MECKMKQLSTEVAVIGAGPAGMATALTAARLGRKVVIFEKGDHYGGAIGGGKGPLGINTLQQRRLQRVVTEEMKHSNILWITATGEQIRHWLRHM